MSKLANRNRVSRRSVDGILVVDKWLGASSNTVLQRVKRLFNAKKAGHTGSLDPLATGVLPVCFGEATKFCQYLLESDKRYVTLARLGVRTTTGDSEGEVISESPVALELASVQKALGKFVGSISQIPPMFSAVKFQGTPLYKLARKGQVVERASRQVTIHHLDLLHFDAEQAQLKLEIYCSKGTYIRTLIDDLGQALGCGAHVVKLERTQAGPYSGKMHSLESLQTLYKQGGTAALDELLLPVDSALRNWPRLDLVPSDARFLLRGRAVKLADQALEQGLARLYVQPGERFLGVGQVLADGSIAPRRFLAQNLEYP